MLYTDAKNFLLSTLKKGEESKFAVRAMFDLIRCDFPHLEKLRITDTIHMTDLKVILTLWRLQIEQAELALRTFAPQNVMASLYGEQLVENPIDSLRAANRFLELGISTDQLEQIARSDRRFTDAKNANIPFSVEKRKEAYRMVHGNPGTRLRPNLTGALEV
jgi:hypothetical protein